VVADSTTARSRASIGIINHFQLGLYQWPPTFNVARVKAKPQVSNHKPDNMPDFEHSLSELEALVQKLEQGDVPLEEALKTFERGVALTRQCQTALRSAQQKVEVLLTKNGEERIEPLEQDPDEEDEDDDDAGR
jgi:exodeoxyribonuclease VII small subunit